MEAGLFKESKILITSYCKGRECYNPLALDVSTILMIIKKLKIQLGCGDHEFDSKLWQAQPKSRKCFFKNIIDSQFALGMTEKQVANTFGIDRKIYSTGVWSYSIPEIKINTKKRFLNFYFNTDGKVENVKLKFKRKIKK